MKTSYYWILLTIPFLVSCEENCNDILQVFTVKVESTNGQSIWLDHHFTLSSSGDTLVNQQVDSAFFASNGFVLLNSSDLNQSGTIRFVGMRDDSVIVDESYTATHDDCSITDVNGPDPIVVP